MSHSWPFVSVIVETSTWHSDGHIQLQDTLQALHAQTYPRDRFHIVVVLAEEHADRWGPIARRFPELRMLQAPSGLSYYQRKGYGLSSASGEIVAFLDADVWVAPDWLQEMARPFLFDESIAAVQGRTRFRDGFLSRMWDAVWWSRAYEPEGPIDRLYSSSNMALRHKALQEHFYDDPNRHRGLWERVMTHRLRSTGGTIWLNPRADLVHDYHPGLVEFAQLALARGYHLLAYRFKYPLGTDRILVAFTWLAPCIVFPGLVVKDAWRMISRAPRAGMRWWELWKVPLYILAYLPIEILVLAGMLLATTRRPAPQLP